MLTVDEALSQILATVSPGEVKFAPLAECTGLTLGEDLTTSHDSPPFSKSMMDGFAVSSNGFASGEQTLRILETITAGTVPSKTISTGCACRIMTGAPVPDGADCVVPIERVQFNEDNPTTVTVNSENVAPEKNVLRQGMVAKTGDELMEAGTSLSAQQIAVLAEFGVANVPVRQKPKIAVLATGDELLSIDQPLTPGRIRNSNEPMLVSQIQRAGGSPLALGVAKDTRESLKPLIQRGLECDILLLSGGVSAGTLDLVPSELAAAGVEEVFHKIKMKPGKPLWFGELKTDEKRCYVFGLPGNPVSSMVCFEIFVRTAMRKIAGLPEPMPPCVTATLTESIAIRGDRETWFPSLLSMTESGIQATPVPWGGSADLRSTARANGMCRLLPRKEGYAAGEKVSALFW